MDGYVHALGVVDLGLHTLGGSAVHIDLMAPFDQLHAHIKGLFILLRVIGVGYGREHKFEHILCVQSRRFYVPLHIITQRRADVDVLWFRYFRL